MIDDEEGEGLSLSWRSRSPAAELALQRIRFGAGRIRYRRDPDDGGRSDGDCAEDGEGHPPTFGRHSDAGERERGVVAGDRCGRCENESDHSARQRRGEDREDGLSDDERESAGREADEQSSSDARPVMASGKASGHAGEDGQRVHGEIEHQPAQEADAEDAEDDADDEHGYELHGQTASGLVRRKHRFG